jgi:hypothetical protein
MSLGTVDATTPPADPPKRRRLWIPFVGLVVALALGWYVSQLLGRSNLFVGFAIGLVPVFLFTVGRWLRRRRRAPAITIVVVFVVVVIAGAFVVATLQGNGSSPGVSGGPPPLRLAVSVTYTAKASVDSGQITLDDEMVVSNAAMGQISDDLLARLRSTSDQGDIRAVLNWCTGGAPVPATWTLPPGLQLSQASAAQIQSVLVDNWAACFNPQRLSSSSWQLTERLDDGYLYARTETDPYDSGSLYSVADVPIDLGDLNPHVSIGGSDVLYGLSAGAGSTLQLSAPSGAIGGLDPSAAVTTLPGVGDQASIALDRDTDDAHVVILTSVLRNKAGHAFYQALLWGPLQWIIGLVSFLFGGIISDFGRNLLKRGFLAVFRRRPAKPVADA